MTNAFSTVIRLLLIVKHRIQSVALCRMKWGGGGGGGGGWEAVSLTFNPGMTTCNVNGTLGSYH